MSNEKYKRQKIFINAMDSWFSNFIIEYFRTDHTPDSKNQTEFMGTINSLETEDYHLPLHLNPSIYKFNFDPSYKNELFSNDIFIYDLNTGNLKEAEYIIKGFKTLKIENEKIIIFISNIMTWAKTPDKIKSDAEDEVIFIHPEKEDKKEEKDKEKEKEKEIEPLRRENSFLSNIKEQSINNSLMGGVNQSKLSIKQMQNKSKLSTIKEEKEENKIIVYYTDKDYLKRKPSLKYFDFKYIENEALNLNQKANIKSYIICPGVIYGYGEKLFYSIFRSALLGYPIEELLLDKGRNWIPTIHMKDLVSIIAKIIEKKPLSYYILAFDQTNNRSLKNIIRMIYYCMGNENNMIEKKETKGQNEEIQGDNNDMNINKQIVKEEKEENEENDKKEENDEGKQTEENAEKKAENNKPIIHPFFLNKKYQISEYFPRELLYLDVKILPSEFIKGDFKEKDKIYTPLFKWHCPSGIISNSDSVKKEFLKYRDLISNKIFILGNPYTGKTTISQILSKIFHLPIISIKSIADFGKQFAGIKEKSEAEEEKKENNENNNEENNVENTNKENENNQKNNNENEVKENIEENIFIKRKTSEDNDLILEIQNEIKKLEENRAEAEEAYNKRPNKKKTDPPFDENMYYRFSDELMSKILNKRLLENDTVTYGYIIDGFPKNYAQLEELFKDGEKSIAYPNSIILFEDIEDDICINRIKNSEEVLKDPKDPKVNIMIERANRRLAKVKEDKSDENYKSLKDFFNEEENNKIFKDKLMVIDGKNSTILDIIKTTQEFIKKNNGNSFNKIDEGLECNDYLYDYVKIEEEKNKPNPEETNEVNKEKKDNENLEENKEINENEEIKKEETNIDKEKENKEEPKEKEEEPKPKTKLEIEKENEFKLLEKKSEVLRRYLAENVLPLLSLGILHVANELPDDPVEALADYLLAKTFELKKNGDVKEDNEKLNENENDNDNVHIDLMEDKNISIDLNEDKNVVKLNIEEEQKKVDKITRNISPIERMNSNKENKENKESKESKESNEDELNKGMIESNE